MGIEACFEERNRNNNNELIRFINGQVIYNTSLVLNIDTKSQDKNEAQLTIKEDKDKNTDYRGEKEIEEIIKNFEIEYMENQNDYLDNNDLSKNNSTNYDDYEAKENDNINKIIIIIILKKEK